MNKVICWLRGLWYSFPFDGIPISGHCFVDTEVHENCQVTVGYCETCGEVDISWAKGNSMEAQSIRTHNHD